MRTIAGLLICALALTSLGASSCENNASKSTTAPTPARAAGTKVALPANQAQIGDLLLTVNGAQETTNTVFPAPAGMHYVAVDLSAQNTGAKTYSLNALNFHLKSSDGFANAAEVGIGPEPHLTTHTLAPGQSVRAYLAFTLKDGAQPAELQYQSFTGTPGTIAIH